MRKGLKKILALTMVLGTVISVNSVAFADTPSYRFELSAGSKGYTSQTQKHDTDQNAYVYVDYVRYSCCPGPDAFYYRSRTAAGAMASDVRSRAGTGTVRLPYTVLYGQKGAYYKLYGQFDGDRAHPSNTSRGSWNA